MDLRLRDEATFDNYYVGENGALVACLRAVAEGAGEPLVYLWGAPGSGRTHLLHACCRAMEPPMGAIYLPLRRCDFMPAALEQLEQQRLVCLDDVDAIGGERAWEEALFHLFNRARETGTRLVVSAGAPPEAARFKLRDWVSRLQGGPVFQVRDLNDDQKLVALQLRADRRGLSLPDATGRFLLRRFSRDLHALFTLLDTLDLASLAAQRRLTIPFVRSLVLPGAGR